MNQLKKICGLVLLGTLLCLTACEKDKPDANANNQEDTREAKPMATPITFVHDEGGIEFTAPKGWKSPNTDKDGDEVIALESPDEQLEVTFYVPDDESVEEASQGIVEDLAKYIKNAKVTQSGRESAINGLKTLTIAGTGVDADDDDKVDWVLTIIEAKKPLFVVSLATQGAYAKNDAAYQMLIQSIKPVATKTGTPAATKTGAPAATKTGAPKP